MPDKDLSKKVISELLAADGREIVEIAKDLEISKQRLGNYKDGKRFPDAEFIQKWQKTFGQNLMDLMDKAKGQSTNVSRGTVKHTSVEKTGDNKEFNESVYRTIVEGNTEYLLVPRSILNETQLISKDEIAEKKREMERKNKQIDFYQEQFSKLMDGLELITKPTKSKKV